MAISAAWSVQAIDESLPVSELKDTRLVFFPEAGWLDTCAHLSKVVVVQCESIGLRRFAALAALCSTSQLRTLGAHFASL